MAGVMEQACVEPIRKGFNVVSTMVDEGIAAAKRMGKQTSDAAEDFMEDTTHRIRRHPAETVVGAFVAGILVGGLLGFVLRRK